VFNRNGDQRPVAWNPQLAGRTTFGSIYRQTGDVSYFGFPYFPGSGYGTAYPRNLATYSNGKGNGYNELGRHASLFNVFRPYTGLDNTNPNAAAGDGKTIFGTNRFLPVAGMAGMLRFKATGSDMLNSDLLRLLPNNLVGNPPSLLNADAARRRNLTGGT
jgi:hypothetical protein